MNCFYLFVILSFFIIQLVIAQCNPPCSLTFTCCNGTCCTTTETCCNGLTCCSDIETCYNGICCSYMEKYCNGKCINSDLNCCGNWTCNSNQYCTKCGQCQDCPRLSIGCGNECCDLFGFICDNGNCKPRKESISINRDISNIKEIKERDKKIERDIKEIKKNDKKIERDIKEREKKKRKKDKK